VDNESKLGFERVISSVFLISNFENVPKTVWKWIKKMEFPKFI